MSFPERKGTATAFPIAAYGLSAFFFATVALAFPHDTPHFLLVLATGTVVLPLISFPFLQTPEQQNYETIPQHESSILRRTRQEKRSRPNTTTQEHDAELRPSFEQSSIENDNVSLFSNDSSDEIAEFEISKNIEEDHQRQSSNIDIRGIALIRRLEFWQLFGMLGLLAGVGLMTIK